MNILQFNVRLAEGGAAGVALDLHQRALHIEYWFMLHYIYYTPKIITVPEKERVISEVIQISETNG